MNDLNAAIEDLHVLQDSYARRAHDNGPGHDDNPYLWRQADRFLTARLALQAAVAEANSR